MKKVATEMVAEIKQIHEQYLAEVGVGGHKVWPRSIRDRIFELVENVGSVKAASDMCGISCQTIYQWRSDLKKNNFKSLTVVESAPKSTTVTVPKVNLESRPKESSTTVTVITPGGFTIKGLKASDALKILLKLGIR
jgi:hypothetical protein